MKLLKFAGLFIAAVLFFTGASVWEGSAAAVSSGDLPGGYSVATNSFPRNSVIDITNLENGRTVRVIVVDDLKTSGLLATLSRSSAEAIGLSGDSVCRIRMTQPSDDIAFSRYRQGPLPSTAEVEIGPQASLPLALPPTLSGILSSSIITGGNATAGEPSSAGTAAAVVAPTAPATAAPAPTVATPAVAAPTVAATAAPSPTVTATAVPSPAVAPPAVPSAAENGTAAANPASNEIIFVFPSTFAAEAERTRQTPQTIPTTAAPEPEKNIVLVNAEDRIPAGEQPAFAPEEMIGPINGIVYYVPDEYTYRPGTATAGTATVAAVTNPAPEAGNTLPSGPFPAGTRLSPFSAPIINSMEAGMWYVQVGAFSFPDGVEYEINRIGTAYPTVVQITGTDSAPVYRILLGPLSQGESGAMLQRFKSIGYKDAFIWSN